MYRSAIVLSAVATVVYGQVAGGVPVGSGVLIQAYSAGYSDGDTARIRVAGQLLVEARDANGRGVNLVVLDPSGKPNFKSSFDTYQEQDDAAQLADKLESLKPGEVAICAVCDEATRAMTNAVIEALEKLGAKQAKKYLKPAENPENPVGVQYRSSYVFIAQKGGNVLAEDGAFAGEGAVSARVVFRTKPSTTTTTTTNTLVAALHRRLAGLEAQLRASGDAAATKEDLASLAAAVVEVEGAVEDEVVARKAADAEAADRIVDVRKKLEAAAEERQTLFEHVYQLQDALEALNKSTATTIATLKAELAAFKTAPVVQSTSGDPRVGFADITPEISAVGGTINLRGSAISFESDACGTADLCQLQRQVDALTSKFGDGV